MPVLLYAVESMKVSSRNFNSFEFAYTAAFGKIFGTYDKNIIRSCQFYCGATPISYNIDNRRFNFLNSLSDTRICHLHYLYVISGKDELNDILVKYNLDIRYNIFNLKSTLWNHFANSFDIICGSLIICLNFANALAVFL